MKSNAQKGSYFKTKTKKWLEAQGYQVGFLERMFMLFIKGRMIPIKRDQFGSDLLAVSEDDIIFVQVKMGKDNVASARKEFDKFVFPCFSQRWIVAWEPRVREPIVIKVPRNNKDNKIKSW